MQLASCSARENGGKLHPDVSSEYVSGLVNKLVRLRAEMGVSGDRLGLACDLRRGWAFRDIVGLVAMGRLKQLRGRLRPVPLRLAFAPKRAEGFYQSPEWQNYRREHRAWTIARQGGVWCCTCGSTERLILDHRRERKDGGADFPPFEEADWVCAKHHNAKTARERLKRATDGAGGGSKSLGG